MLVTLLLSQPIEFLNDNFWALGGLAFNLLLLWIGVGYLLQQEIRHLDEVEAGVATGTSAGTQ